MALTLVRLRWTLTLNQWRRSPFTLVMSVLGALYVLGMAAVAIGFEPGIIDVAVPACLLYAAWVLTRKVILPFRLPKGARRKDYNHPNPENRRPRMAAGIIYIGRDFRTGQQLWIANEDGRQHVVVPGTTLAYVDISTSVSGTVGFRS